MSNTQTISLEQFIALRGSLDPSVSTYFTFQGSVSVALQGYRAAGLFDFIGVSATRCTPLPDGSFGMSICEVMLYLDPVTGEVIDEWLNPFTDERVRVMHVANNPILVKVAGSQLIDRRNDLVSLTVEMFPQSPNPLNISHRFDPYSTGLKQYSSWECFRFVVPDSSRSLFAETPRVNQVLLHWNRTSQWLPWMQMGTQCQVQPEFQLASVVFTGSGNKVSLEELDDRLLTRINSNVPQFLEAPVWQDKGTPFWGVTSWKYFVEHIDAYEAGAIFPL